MDYPAPPWTNKGQALQVLRLVDVARVRSLIPAPLKIVPILPGKTIGIVYFADYEPGSAITYHELIIAPALVHLGRHFGWWISHIYVDQPDSMAGGREIWGLPKEMARFNWNLAAGQVEAYQDNKLLCGLRSRPPASGVRMVMFLLAIARLGPQLLAFRGDISSKLSLAPAVVEIPATSPIASLHLSGRTRAFHFTNMTFTASAPWVIGH